VDRNRLVVPTTPTTGYAAITAELARLTARDRRLLHLLDQHQVLATEHIISLAFGSRNRALSRLSLLYRRGILDRFRHYHRPGSQSWRWTLGPLGAGIVAAGRGEPLPRPAAVRDRTARLATGPTLSHLLGVNGFFAHLAAHARAHDGHDLARWWPEQRSTRAIGRLARPDAHGVWAAHGRRVPFFLEYDTGTEPLHRLVRKLGDYAALAGTRWALPVLFWLPSSVREANLHQHLHRTGRPPAGVTVATAAADHATGHGGPAGPVWLVIGHGGRRLLADLPTPPASPDQSTVDSDTWAV
jgi:Replication-relaxation